MNMPKTVVKAAIKHGLNVGRAHDGTYFVRDPQTLQIVEMTRSANPTVSQALAMIKRAIR